jgi:hypothetical protein
MARAAESGESMSERSELTAKARGQGQAQGDERLPVDRHLLDALAASRPHPQDPTLPIRAASR